MKTGRKMVKEGRGQTAGRGNGVRGEGRRRAEAEGRSPFPRVWCGGALELSLTSMDSRPYKLLKE